MNKGLDALKELLEILDYYKDKAQRNFQTIRIFSELPNYIKEIETELKALEIIKKKKVNVHLLVDKEYCPDLDHYNCYAFDNLSKEEYQHLKEVLCND